MRALISLLVAAIASIAGTLLLWYGGGNVVYSYGQYFGTEPARTAPFLLALAAGALLLGVAAFSIRWSSVGVLVVGAIHVLFSLLVFLVPYAPLRSGMVSPAIQLLDLLRVGDPGLYGGAYYVVSYGGELLIGTAMLGVAAMARRSAGSGLRIASAVGGVLALGAFAGTVGAGGDFYAHAFRYLDWQLVPGLLTVLAALAFGALLAPSGAAPIGAWVAGGVLTVLGVLLALATPGTLAGLPPAVADTVSAVAWSGLLLGVGVSVLGLALGVTLRRRAARPAV